MGHVYQDAKSGQYCVYMGTVNIKYIDRHNTSPIAKFVNDIKHVYIRCHNKNDLTAFKIAEHNIWENGKYTCVSSHKHPLLLKCYYNNELSSFNYGKSYHVITLKNKAQVSVCDVSSEDLFKDYTEQDWDNIEKEYNKYQKETKWGNDSWTGVVGDHKLNTRQEYLAQTSK